MNIRIVPALLALCLISAGSCYAQKYHDAVVNHLKGHVRTYELSWNGSLQNKYEYNSDGKLIKEFWGKEPTKYTYNNEGYPIEDHKTGRASNTFFYDSNHRIIRQGGYSNLRFYYNNNGNLVKEVRPPENSYTTQTTTTYTINAIDSYGNPTDYTAETIIIDTATGKPTGKPRSGRYTAKYSYWDTAGTPSAGGGSANSRAPRPASGTSSGQKAKNESSYFHVSGVVTDQYGNPLEGIIVCPAASGASVHTDANGRFTLHYTHEGAGFYAFRNGEMTKCRDFVITRENRTKELIIKLNL